MLEAQHLVDGRFTGTPTKRVHNPVDDSMAGMVAVDDGNMVAAAADAAAVAQPKWGSLPARERCDLLVAASEAIAASAERLGELLAAETGKRRPEAVGEVTFSAEYFRWFAEEARRPVGAVHSHEAPSRRHFTIRRPAGVVASLTPWNFPCSIQARKLAPALAAGCTVVARVSEKAPLAVTEMIRLVHEVGLPPGVLNLVHGPAAATTSALLDHPAVRVVSFTGSTLVGRAIMHQASARIVRPLLELGGDAPFIVFDDADVPAAVEGAMVAKFRNAGQSCIGANRFLVHERVFDEFTSEFASRIDEMSVGDGLADPVPDLGPCIDAHRAREVQGMVDEAVTGGGRLLTRMVDVPGPAWCAPALVADAPDNSALATSEVFGPAAAVFSFGDDDEALRRANGTEMGLAGYFYTRDVARAWRVAERLEVGIVGINNPLPTTVIAPMGGVKQSGLGREGSSLGLEEFQDVRYVALSV